MKKIILLIIVCLGLCTYNANAADARRVVTQNYPADKNTTLMIQNRYGDVNIQEWGKNEIDFSVEITASHRNQATADDFVNAVNIYFSNNANLVQAITDFGRNFENNSGNNNIQHKITYTVKVPKGISYKLINKYGNITMGDASNKVSIDIKYGNFNANNLPGDNNSITCKYGNINAHDFGKMSIDLGYGKLNLSNGRDLILNSKYSSGNLGKIGSIQLVSKYEKYSITEVDNLEASIGYTTLNIDKINTSFKTTDAKYGAINVSNTGSNLKDIKINARYTNINIGVPDNLSYKIDAYAKYASIKVKNGTSIHTRTSEKNTETCIGTVGSNPQATIKISSEYGSIKIQ